MYRWNISAQRYQDTVTGRFISRAEVLAFVDEALAASRAASDTLVTLLAEGTLAPNDWRNAFWEELKREYIREYLSGIGGRAVMTQADWGSIGGMLKEQVAYLNNFAAEIALGNLSEGQIRFRAQMYLNSAREAHERARSRAAGKFGADEIQWVLYPEAEHCDTCQGRADQGWQPIAPNGGFPDPDAPEGGAFPADGTSQCLTNDQCSTQYRNSKTGEAWEG